MNTIKLEINRAIAELENNYPSDNLISSYKDFVKYRDYLHLYQYNEAVVVSLIDLIYSLWYTNQRINKTSLLTVTKRYFKKSETKANIPYKTTRKIFELFKEIIYNGNLKLSSEAVDRIKKSINSIMIGIDLQESEIQWLCKHSYNSDYILNRVLRYHKKSDYITKWAIDNFEKDFARNRRSEITSWIIDKSPNFKINKEIVINDFEYQIAEDKKLVETFKKEMEVYNFIEKVFFPLINKKEKEEEVFFVEDSVNYKIISQEKPKFNVPRRYYRMSVIYNSSYNVSFPDFNQIYNYFFDQFDCYYNKLMAWSIAYSRLDIKSKMTLLSEYYSSEIYPTFFSIGKRLKSIEYFEWLKKTAL